MQFSIESTPRAKKKSMESQQKETVEVKIVAELDSVEFQVMTSAIFFAIMRVRDLKATYEQTKTQKEITAKLVDFQGRLSIPIPHRREIPVIDVIFQNSVICGYFAQFNIIYLTSVQASKICNREILRHH